MTAPTPAFSQLLQKPHQLLAFGFGSGLSPKAPGTMGTLVAIPLYLVLAQLSLPVYALVLAGGFVLGIYLCGQSSHDLGVHDHGGIVWDEFVGYWITMLAIPLSWQNVLAGFVLFRLFDIWKPFPIKILDKHAGGGFGIMIDDVLAGFYAWVFLYLANVCAFALSL